MLVGKRTRGAPHALRGPEGLVILKRMRKERDMPVPTLESRKHSQRRGRLYEAGEVFATPRPAVASPAGPQEPLPHLWGLILAGGERQRLHPVMQRSDRNR